MTTVVIAEDEAIIRLDLKELLEAEGYEVVGETGRGDETIGLARELQPDMVILDIKMPGLDGLSAARQLVEDHQYAVVLLTAFSQRNLLDEACHAGVMSYLVKPFSRTELVPAIEIALSRFRELEALRGEVDSLEEQLETRRLVARAKGRLMDEAGMRERDAFDFIQKTAMRRRIRMAEVAQLVLEEGLLAPRAENEG